MKLEDVSIMAWIIKNNIRTEKGQPLDFKQHFYLFDIYRDFAPKQVWLKAAQLGLSTAAIFKTLFIAAKKKMDLIYTLPTDSDVSIFAGGKVNRIIRNNPILGEYIKDQDSVEQKAVGENMIYYRGTFSKRTAIMVTSDLNVHDEEDFSDQEIIADYESRLQHSKYGWQWHFGHPSTEGVGVSKYWPLSDQKHWFVTCPHCGKKQYLSWPDSIDRDKKIYICKSCKQELPDEARRKGEWVKKFKDKEFSGYWIPLLLAPWVTAEKILEYHKDKSEEYFTNRVLGLPYIGSGNKVLQNVILGNLTDAPYRLDENRIVIGVDTGLNLSYVIGNIYGLFHYGETKRYSDIEIMLKRWPTAVAVFDQGGDIIGVRELKEKYPGRVFLCHYRADRKTLQLVQWGKDKEEGNVVVDRNRMIQWVIDEFRDRRIPLFGDEAKWWDFWLDWNRIYRVMEEDSLGVMRAKWLRNGRDHYAHATCYWRTGMSRFAHGQGSIYTPFNQDYVVAPLAGESGIESQNPIRPQTQKLPIIHDWRIV